MDPETNISKLIKDFYNRKKDNFNMYIEGFGGIFVKRTKDGMVLGYTDKTKRFGLDDHVTIFFGKSELKGIHRKVADSNTEVYMKFNENYFQSPSGIKSLMTDIQRRSDVPKIMRALMPILYENLKYIYTESGFASANILKDSQAKALGMESPCLYINPGLIKKFILIPLDKIIRFQQKTYMEKFKGNANKGFKEQNIPGNIITKRKKKP